MAFSRQLLFGCSDLGMLVTLQDLHGGKSDVTGNLMI